MSEQPKITAILSSVAAGALMLSVPVSAVGEEYPDPDREIRHIMPWGAGGGTDSAMRGFVEHMQTHLGTAIYTDNVTGGVGSVGWMTLKDAEPDGYTIGTLTYDILTVEFQGMAPVSWQDFELIGTVTEHATALVVRADDFEELDEFIAVAEEEPGSLPTSNASTGGVWHQHAVAMERELGIELNHVPYESAAPQVTSLLGGETDAAVISLPPVMEYVRSGEMRVLAVMADERVDLVPDVPTFTELGHDVVYGSFRSLAAPGGTPEEIIEVLEHAAAETFEDPEFQEWAEEAAIGARWLNREDTRAYLENLAPDIEALMSELDL